MARIGRYLQRMKHPETEHCMPSLQLHFRRKASTTLDKRRMVHIYLSIKALPVILPRRARALQAVSSPGIGSSEIGGPATQRELLALSLDKPWDGFNACMCLGVIRSKTRTGARSCRLNLGTLDTCIRSCSRVFGHRQTEKDISGASFNR